MDIPEPNTVWPPAPTLPPPEAEGRKPFKLPLPEWIAVTLKDSAEVSAVMYGLLMAINWCFTHQILHEHWTFYARTAVAFLTYNGIKNWRKFHPRVK